MQLYTIPLVSIIVVPPNLCDVAVVQIIQQIRQYINVKIDVEIPLFTLGSWRCLRSKILIMTPDGRKSNNYVLFLVHSGKILDSNSVYSNFFNLNVDLNYKCELCPMCSPYTCVGQFCMYISPWSIYRTVHLCFNSWAVPLSHGSSTVCICSVCQSAFRVPVVYHTVGPFVSLGLLYSLAC